MGDKLLSMLPEIDPARHVLIAGPTASGKSALALAIAQAQGGLVVNADALQVYGCWRVLTARPSGAEEEMAPHALYGHVGQNQPYSAGHWLREVAALLGQGKRLIITGGTGLYFAALTDGLVDIPPIPVAVRAEADKLTLSSLIAGVDPATLKKIDRANRARVQRAWEVRATTGRGLVDWQADTGAPVLALADVVPMVFRARPDWLAARIEARFTAMLAAGAVEEAHAALPHWQPTAPWAKAIGAPDLAAHLRGEITLSEAAARATLASRQYAKRQQTWFRARMRDWHNLEL